MKFSKLRRLFFYILTPALVLTIILKSWTTGLTTISQSGEELVAPAPAIDSMADRIFTIQSQILLGGILSARETAAAGGLNPLGPRFEETLRQTFKKNEIDPLLGGEQQVRAGLELTPRRLLKTLIVAHYLGLNQEVQQLRSQLESKNDMTEPDKALFAAVKRTLAVESPSPSAAELTSIRQELGWFGLLALHSGDQPTLSAEEAERELFAPARSMLEKFMKVLVLGVSLALGSVALVIIFLILLFRKEIAFQFNLGEMPSQFGLEIFALYLLAMLVGSEGLQYIQSNFPSMPPLALNLALILLMPVALLWPLLFGVSLSAVRRSIGLFAGGMRRFLNHIAVGVGTYIGSWTILIVVLVAYSAIISYFEIDFSRGAHPIVPVLLSANPAQTIILVLFAVVVAPIVEEIMFRGALYTWLRARLGAASAMVSSALIFAVVHPQGAVGIIPLATIGIVLAFVREWRNSLFACMATHACFNAGTLAFVLLLFR